MDGGAPEWEGFPEEGSAAGERLSWAAAEFRVFLHDPGQVHSHLSPTSASLTSSL